MPALTILTRVGCTTTALLRMRLDDALVRLGEPARYEVIDVATLPDSDSRRGYPTPTLLCAGRDLFGMPEPRLPFAAPT